MTACALSTTSEPTDAVEDALDLFSDSLTSLFDEHMPAKGDPLQLYIYTPPSATGQPPLTCRIPPQQVNSLFAHHVWSASLRLADALAERRLRVEGEDVLELGAGAGIAGLMAARMGAKKVIISDYDDPALVANLKGNIKLAFPDSPDIQARLQAIGHSWAEEESLQALLLANSDSPFSHILLADTLWSPTFYSPLLLSLTRLLARTSTARAHICAGFHSGRATVRSFLRKARKEGFVLKGEWVEVGMNGERRPWGWDIEGKVEGDEGQWEEKEDQSQRNKWVVEGDLGWNEAALS
ncbi:hypothetical protein JCM11641_005920 [Rhodosporidiobolus odoratus]